MRKHQFWFADVPTRATGTAKTPSIAMLCAGLELLGLSQAIWSLLNGMSS